MMVKLAKVNPIPQARSRQTEVCRKQKHSLAGVFFIMLAFLYFVAYNKSMHIRRAAILFQGGGIVEGGEYNQILGIGHRFGFTGTYVSGYLDSEGNFIDRNTAMKIAKEAGQLPEDFTGPLQPEDLFKSEGYEIN